MHTNAGAARPRAYYPDYVNSPPPRHGAPGWDLGPERQIDDGRTAARALGWFSIGLGLVQVAAPGRVTQLLGVDERHETLIRFYGVREIAHGVAILSQRTPRAGVWSRVGGDALDMATLGLSLAREAPRRERVLAGMAFVAGAAALDFMTARRLNRVSGRSGRRAS